MNTVSIESTIDKVDKIFHIADVHIRNYKRHREYRQVFQKLYELIYKHKTKNSIIYVAGDLVHSKNELSPELVDLLGNFLRKLANICPTFIIMGNHDLNLNNRHRLDAITPIVEAINSPTLYFLDQNSYYTYAQLGFSVFEVGTDPSEWGPASGLDSEVKIALHHGAVNKACTETNIVLRNKEVTSDTFKGFDLGLLGDIHKRQFLDEKQHIAYAGSLIQQNYGEDFEKGILIWDVSSLTSEFYQIQNDFEYRTLYINNGEVSNWSDNIALHPRVRLKVTDTSATQLRAIVKRIRGLRKVEELKVLKDYSFNEKRNIGLTDINIRDVEYQNKLICDYLEDAFNLSEGVLDLIRHINRETNTKVETLDTLKGKTWSPKYFKFSNMFSYGEDNFLDFENLRGLYGIFAPNASGKSTLFDALCFCIFDKCSKTFKSTNILNVEKEEFTCEFCFEADNQTFYIKKRGHKGYSAKAFKDKVKVDVDFYTFDHSGKKISLNGDQRDSTNKVIQSYIGTYSDFILTALATQNSSTNFINKSQRERKELLVRFLDLGIFEELFDIASSASKETSTLIKELERKDLDNTLIKTKTVIEKSTVELVNYNKEEANLKVKLSKLNKEVKTLLSKRHNLDTFGELRSIEVLEESLIKLSSTREGLRTSIESRKRVLKEAETNLDRLVLEQRELKESNFELKIKERDIVLSQIEYVNKTLDVLSNSISVIKLKIAKLEEHEYDPECKYCVANPWVKDAHDSTKTLPPLLEEYKAAENELISLNTKLVEELNPYVEVSEKFLSNEKEISSISIDILHASSFIKECENKIENTLGEKKLIEREKHYVKKHKKHISENIAIDGELTRLNTKISLLETTQDIQSKEMLKVYGAKETALQRKEVVLSDIEDLSRLYKEYEAYDFYLKSIKRDGVPYKLVEDILPQVESEVNRFLEQIVDFQVVLSTDGKNINGHIVYNESRFWPLELGSGMEKFISSLAIRVALINITTLPKSNFLAIDEGFGVLDSTHMGNIERLFTFLETQFLFTFCISHLDVMKDIAPKTIDIGSNKGFSKINYQ